jgi:3-oxoacyl-[acyl-carrier-protein] synthase-3
MNTAPTSASPHRPWLQRGALALLGSGATLPGPSIATEELLQFLQQRFGVDLRRRGLAVARRLGVRTRHVSRALRERSEAPRAEHGNAALAARAVQAALADAGVRIDVVRYLIGHTATPGRLLPPGIAEVAGRLGYTGPYCELRQACTGFANALLVAHGLLATSGDGVIVIVGSETGSVYFDPLRAAVDDAQLINLLQMGDAAAAVVLAPAREHAPTLRNCWFGQIGHDRPAGFQLRAGGSDHLAAENPAEFLHDFMAIRHDGERLFQAGVDAAASLGTRLADVHWFLPHQANGHMAALLGHALHVDAARVFVNADRYGNTGSAAIWLALHELRGTMRPAERALVLGAEATQFMYGGFIYENA